MSSLACEGQKDQHGGIELPIRGQKPASADTSTTSASSGRLEHSLFSTLYQYTPLNEEAQEIRVIELLPGQARSEIRVLLHVRPFTEAEEYPVDFEALSYVWGSQENSVNILVGKSGNQAVTATQNLAAALPYLRHEHESRFLWIDAICVNQKDLKERSSQVRRMADIYSKASRVVIWLGPDTDDSSVAVDCVRLLATKVEVDWGLQQLHAITDEDHWADRNTKLPFDEDQLLAICHLMNRDWFHRLWIWQEVCLAKTAIMMCGTDLLLWKDMRKMLFCSYVKTKPVIDANVSVTHQETLYFLSLRHVDASLFQLVDRTKHSLCSDPRDRIFALLSMLPEWERALQITPDYSKDKSEIYRDVALQHIQTQRSLEVLREVEVREGVTHGAWVPDWSVPRATEPFHFQCAAGYSTTCAELTESGSLRVHGRVLSGVKALEPFSIGKTRTRVDIVLELQRVARAINLRAWMKENPVNVTKLCRILCSNQFSSTLVPSDPGFPDLQQSDKFLRSLLCEPRNVAHALFWDSLIYPAHALFLDCLIYHCRGRALFKTRDGHIGIGPAGMEIGDIAIVLLGCDSLMIMRSIEGNRYLVIGEACISDAMHGEALLGPMAESLVHRFVEPLQAYYNAFLDPETGLICTEDPRLTGVSLPEGWRREEHESMEYFSRFVNDDTGERRPETRDPRMDLDELRKRGVEIQEFELL